MLECGWCGWDKLGQWQPNVHRAAAEHKQPEPAGRLVRGVKPHEDKEAAVLVLRVHALEGVVLSSGLDVPIRRKRFAHCG